MRVRMLRQILQVVKTDEELENKADSYMYRSLLPARQGHSADVLLSPLCLLSRCHQPDWPAPVECGLANHIQGCLIKDHACRGRSLLASLPVRAALHGVECGIQFELP